MLAWYFDTRVMVAIFIEIYNRSNNYYCISHATPTDNFHWMYYMSAKKIVCGVAEPKKGERRGTFKECQAKKQLRYYGVEAINPKDLVSGKKEKQPTPSEIIGRASGLRTRIKRLKNEIERGMNAKVVNTTKINELKKELKKAVEEYAKVMPLANKYIEELSKKR
jgi:hypothetical protein